MEVARLAIAISHGSCNNTIGTSDEVVCVSWAAPETYAPVPLQLGAAVQVGLGPAIEQECKEPASSRGNPA